MGTSVLPLIICGGTSKLTGTPSTYAVLLPICIVTKTLSDSPLVPGMQSNETNKRTNTNEKTF
ncbi:MAG: hypothetical protein ACP5QX_07215, partial [Caldisericaceae bacterium]